MFELRVARTQLPGILLNIWAGKYRMAHPASGDKLLGEKAIAHKATSIEPRDAVPHAASI
jgi:hypothetical protein